MNHLCLFTCVTFFALTINSPAAEITVTTDAEVAAAIEKAQPGDTITFKAGNYTGGWTLKPGAPDKPITLRAERADRVFIGSIGFIGGFKPVEGFHYTLATAATNAPEKLREMDTGRELRWMATPIDVEEVVGSYCFDEETKRLLVHPTDSAGTDHHTYAPIVTKSGLLISSHNVIDGLIMTGFGDGAIKGTKVEGVTVQNCKIYRNGYGVLLDSSKNCIVRNNEFWLNRPDYSQGGHVTFFNGAEGMLVEANIVHGGIDENNGVFFYGGTIKNNVIRRNIMWNLPGVYGSTIKGPDLANNLAEYNVCMALFGTDTMRHNTYMAPVLAEDNPEFDLDLSKFKDDPKFVDPAWRDYRLQSDSPARGKDGNDLGAFPYKGDVFFVKPDGDDKAEGTSVAAAWKTIARATKALKAGQTLYVLPGTYADPLALKGLKASDGQKTLVRVHGKGKAWVKSVTVNDCAGIEIAGFHIKAARDEGVRIEKSRDVLVQHCASYQNRGDGVVVKDSGNVSLRRLALWKNGGKSLHVEKSSDVELLSSIVSDNKEPLGAEGFHAKYNVTSDVQVIDAAAGDFRVPAGTPLVTAGLYDAEVGPEGVAVRGKIERKTFERVEVVSVTSTSANFLWYTPARMCGTALKWGEPGNATNVYDRASNESHSEYELVHTVSVIGLKPGTTYQFRPGYADTGAPGNPLIWDDKDYTFTTTKEDPKARQLFVSLEGNDSHDGLSRATAWRTLHKAAREARAGDTVSISPGRYPELLRPLQTGTSEDRRVTFRAEKPLSVILDGGMIKFKRPGRPHNVQLHGKAFITIENLTGERCTENIDYGGYRGGWGYAGIFRVSGGAMNVFKGCVADARYRFMVGFCSFDGGNMPGLDKPEYAMRISDSATLACWRAVLGFARAPIVMEHNVFFSSMTAALSLYLDPGKWIVRNSIYQDLTVSKRRAANPMFSKLATSLLDSDYNCFAWLPETSKTIYDLNEKKIQGVEAWRAVSSNDLHSIEHTPSYPLTKLDLNGSYDQRPLVIEDFLLPPDSPLRGKGANGVDIGVRWKQ